MDNRPAFDRDLLIPILIGGLSVVGIVAVLLIGRFRNAPGEVAMTPSSTPFQYIYLGTEPVVTTLVVEGSELPVSEEPVTGEPITEEPVTEAPVFTPTRSSVSTPMILKSPTRASTSAVVRTNTPGGPPGSDGNGPPIATTTLTASAANTYDDTDTRLKYSGDWATESGLSDSGPSAAYQGTLHVSNVAGSNSVSFTFTGQEIHLFYQSGPSSGILTIFIDSDTLGIQLNQTQGGGEWSKTLSNAGSHTIKIVHTSGGSVNIDKLVIPASTP